MNIRLAAALCAVFFGGNGTAYASDRLIPQNPVKVAPISSHPINTVIIDERIHKLMQHPDMVGLAVAIVENGEITFAKGYGETLKGSGDPVTSDTVFRWASVSKSVAAATVMSLSEEGRLGLTSPIAAYAPSLKLPKTAHTVRVENILTHTTGIVRNAYDTRIEDGEPAKLVRTALQDLPRLCDPGTCHTYQNVAYDALSEAVESATGLPYKAVVADRFFGPLHMSTASVTLQGLQRSKSWARPHSYKGKAISAVSENYYHLPGAAGVNSSVTDLARWMQAQMSSEYDVLSTVSRTRMQHPWIATPRENRIMRWRYPVMKDAHYGLGWRVYDYDGHQVVGHRGAVEGYRAALLFDPERQTGIALMWNSAAWQPVGLQLELMDQLYGMGRRDWMRLSKL